MDPRNEIDNRPNDTTSQATPAEDSSTLPTTVSSTPAVIDSQWESKADYMAQRAQVDDRVPVGMTPPKSKMTYIALLTFAVSVIIFVLAITTPLGRSVVIEPDYNASRGMDAYPVVGLSALVAVLSYFVYAALGLRDAVRRSKRKWPYITLLIMGTVALANPIGLFIAILVIQCNLVTCSGT